MIPNSHTRRWRPLPSLLATIALAQIASGYGLRSILASGSVSDTPSGAPIRNQPSSADFGSLAGRYDRLRPADEGWLELLELVWEAGDLGGRSVLDVGCGTGVLVAELARRGARAVGVDASPEMLSQARGRLGSTAGLRVGTAEALPFADGRFERAVLRLVIHLVDRGRALPELARVLSPAGIALIATFRPEHFDRFWLNPYFPSIPAIDAARFPDPAVLATELRQAGFVTVTTRPLSQRRVATREEALERIRGRFISSLYLLTEEEFRAGVAAAERGLPAQIEYELHWALLVARKPPY